MPPKARVAKPAKPSKTSSAARAGTTQVQIRMPEDLLAALDGYVDGLNGERGFPKLTRTDAILGVLEWAIRTRPNWEGRAK